MCAKISDAPKITTTQGSGGLPFAIPVHVTSKRHTLSPPCGTIDPGRSGLIQFPIELWPVLSDPLESAFDVAAEVVCGNNASSLRLMARRSPRAWAHCSMANP